jgi:hypothetical protein
MGGARLIPRLIRMADTNLHPWILGRLSPEAERARFVIMHASDPLVVVQALGVIAIENERLLHESVADARAQGHTWQLIADALGVTRQAAQRRFGNGVEDDAGQSSAST